MLGYSLVVMLALVVSSPWWLLRMLTTQRYREGLPQRLGRVPTRLREFARGHRIVWLHAVSVGEVLAATRLVAELEAALREQDDSFRVAISTTTRTGQELARQRFGAERVFYYPLDLGFAVRAYLDVLRTEALVLMESELWPRMLAECARRGIPVSVVNARVSDRSFARAKTFRAIWSRLLRKVTLFLAQSEEDARRLVSLGARAEGVRTSGNLKYDVRPAQDNAMKRRIASLLGESRLIVAGSTLEGEETALLNAWKTVAQRAPGFALMMAPRHPERFEPVTQLVHERGFGFFRCSQLKEQTEPIFPGTILILDTIGDLAAMYELATVAFIGGSLVPRGGHNPLEPAQFGVPVVMGPSFENFRDIVAKLQSAGGIHIVSDTAALENTLIELLTHPDEARAVGERGREVFATETGATARTVDAIVQLISSAPTGGTR